jgi:hypothetical protein
MKTKKILLLLICALFCLTKATALPYYYNTTKTFVDGQYTYQCDVPEWKLVTLYNKANKYTYTYYKYKDGSSVSDPKILRGYIALIADDNWTRKKCTSLVNNAFSSSEKQRVKGKKVQVIMTVDTSTGKVIEVHFRFAYNNPVATIPVHTFIQIELALKNEIWFTITDTGKTLKFLKVGWMHEIE